MKAVSYDRFGGPEVLQYLDLPDPAQPVPSSCLSTLRFLAEGLKTGQITSQVDEVLPLNQAAEAHRRLEGREVRGVIVLDPTIES
jgi:NADPH:quinone reductase-like Zn-dependent oxidoreductase